MIKSHKQQEHSESADLCQLPIWRVSMLIQTTPKHSINYSFYHCRAILKISSKFAHNLLTNCRISNWAVSIVIQIATQIESLVPFTTPNPSIKFHCNLFITFFNNVANKQTHKETNKQINTTEDTISLSEIIMLFAN